MGDERPSRTQAVEEADIRLLELGRLQRELGARFSDPRLAVELVPRSSWYSNVRSHVSDAEWDRLRKPVYQRAGSRCEICGGRGPRGEVRVMDRGSR